MDADSRIVALIDHALTVAGPGDSQLRARLLAALADEHGMNDVGYQIVSEAWAVAEGVGEPDTLLYVYAFTVSHRRPGNLEADLAQDEIVRALL